MSLIIQFISFSLLICITFARDQNEFPKNFRFGTGSSAYQVEGAWNVSRKVPSIWDDVTHNHPENIVDRSNADIACDSYHKIDEDIESLKLLNVDFYQFSISWPRLLPEVEVSFVNPDAVRYYNELIDKLIENNITPVVTLHHLDIHHFSQNILGGWISSYIVRDFGAYARIVFNLFGDRVKHWITFNDPVTMCTGNYEYNLVAPFRQYTGMGLYSCTYHVILAHAEAYHVYKNEFIREQKGKVGIAIMLPWLIPASNSKEDVEATERALQMTVDWIIHPLFSENGNIPKVMYERIAEISKIQGYNISRLYGLSEEQSSRVRNTADFLGINHFAQFVVANAEPDFSKPPSQLKDIGITISSNPNGNRTAKDFYGVYPEGIRHLLNYIKDNYNNPVVHITGNGYAGFKNETTEDDERIWYYNAYLNEVLKAINEDNCNVQSYTAWSLMDNFEWANGYTVRFGSFYVDFNNPDRTRVPKKSAHVLSRIFKTHRLD